MYWFPRTCLTTGLTDTTSASFLRPDTTTTHGPIPRTHRLPATLLLLWHIRTTVRTQAPSSEISRRTIRSTVSKICISMRTSVLTTLTVSRKRLCRLTAMTTTISDGMAGAICVSTTSSSPLMLNTDTIGKRRNSIST